MRRILHLLAAILLILVSGLVSIRAFDPNAISSTKSSFNGAPSRLFYFPDSDRILMLDDTHDVWISTDAGKSWSNPSSIPKQSSLQILLHPYSKKIAFVFTGSTTHFKTLDAGETWQRFETPTRPGRSNCLEFNADREDNFIFFGLKCEQIGGLPIERCRNQAYYTKDGFAHTSDLLDYAQSCKFARTTAFQLLTPDSIFCIELKPTKHSIFGQPAPLDFRLVYSENYFKDKEAVDFNGNIDAHAGVFAFGIVQKFLVAAALPDWGHDLDMYVSINGKDWTMAKYPLGTQLKENAYTMLESPPYSLTVDVLTSKSLGTLYKSNSNGTYFTQLLAHTNRVGPFVDFERLEDVEGIMLANVVKNWRDFENVDRPDEQSKIVQTMISVDDGAKWNFLKPPEVDADGKRYSCLEANQQPGDCNLHLHSTTNHKNIGRTFSTKSSPGLIMGVGNVGKRLLPYDQGDTFLSTDGGITWKCVRMGAHMYEVIDSGSIIILIDDEKPTSEIIYSNDRGSSWKTHSLGTTVRARYTNTDPSNLSPKVILLGFAPRALSKRSEGGNVISSVSDNETETMDGNFHFQTVQNHLEASSFTSSNVISPFETTSHMTSDTPIVPHYLEKRSTLEKRQEGSNVIINIDFSKVYPRKCDSNFGSNDLKDFEVWIPRVAGKEEDCLMGRMTSYYRRKPDADCTVSGTQLPPVTKKNCQCTAEDYECDYNYVLNPTTSTCDLFGPDTSQPSSCKPGDFYDAPSGYRKIPGDTCEGKFKYEDPVKRECKAIDLPPDSKRVKKTLKSFDGRVAEMLWFPKSEAILARLDNGQIWRTPDGGATWNRVLQDNSNSLVYMAIHEHDPQRAYVVDSDKRIFVTKNGGESFTQITTPKPINILQKRFFDFHPTEWEWMIFVAQEGTHTITYASRDGGQTWTEGFDTYTEKCLFSQDTKFQRVPKDMIFCLSWEPKEGDQADERNKKKQLVSYSNFGKDKKVLFDRAEDFHVIGSFLAVAARTADNNLDIKISTDGTTFNSGVFPPTIQINKRIFTLLESSDRRIFLNVLKHGIRTEQYGALFISNSNGTLFSVALDNSNIRDDMVEFTRIAGLDGVTIINQLANPTDVSERRREKKVETFISTNDGGRFERIRAPEKGSDCTSNCHLNLHIGRGSSIRSAASAPGILLAVGNTDSSLGDYEYGRSVMSSDGGTTWIQVDDHPNLFGIGNYGGIIVMVEGRKGLTTQKIKYSWDYGKQWEEVVFIDELVYIKDLIFEESGAGSKFLIHVETKGPSDGKTKIVQIDFSDLFGRKCTVKEIESAENDFAHWTMGDITGPRCYLGKKTEYWRRKTVSRCLVEQLPGPGQVNSPPCQCTDDDFECDHHFSRDLNGRCVLLGEDPDKPANCPNGTKYSGRSGYRKIPTSVCEKGKDKERIVEKICGREHQPTKDPEAVIFEFNHQMSDFMYFEESEVVMLLDVEGNLYRSWNEGRSWERLQDTKGKFVMIMFVNEHWKQHGYFLVLDGQVIVTKDKGKTFSAIKLPMQPNTLNLKPLFFHPENPDWIIFIGSNDCRNGRSVFDCHTEAFYTRDGGKNWHSLGTYVKSCQWARTKKFTLVSKTMIFCESYKVKKGNQRDMGRLPLQLVLSDDFFFTSQVIYPETIGSSINGEFMVTAVIAGNHKSLNLSISLDMRTFASAQFMEKLPDNSVGYTVLESHAGTLFLDVLTSNVNGAEYGTLFKSNFNGTFFSKSTDFTNRNNRGYVDYEKMNGIEGVALINQVKNPEDAKSGRTEKQVVTKISRDDGATWVSLTAPATNLKGEKQCQEQSADCNLHLHSFIERRDPQNLFDSLSAPGLMMGVGNVGPHLTKYTDGGIYLTRDAGLTWKQITSEAHMYEFGDHGGLLVLVDDEQATGFVLYSTDEGQTFNKLYFGQNNQPIRVKVITTEPQSTSTKFLLFGVRESDNKPVAIHLDFSNVHDRECILDKNDIGKSDYELWSPSSSRESQCLFGHQIQYYRRKDGVDCYIKKKFADTELIRKDCDCTDADYECDYNYVRSDGKCVLAPGVKLAEVPCDGKPHNISSGYRKIALSTCKDGKRLDEPEVKFCAVGLSGGALAAIIITPILFAGAAGLGWHWYRTGGEFNIRMPSMFRRYRYSRLSTEAF